MIATHLAEHQNLIWENSYEANMDLYNHIKPTVHYDCYNFKILKPTRNTFFVNVAARLEVFTLGDTMLICEVSTNYHLLLTDNNIEDLIFFALERAHEDFLYFFDRKAAGTPIVKYRPEFKWQGLTEQIKNHLQEIS